MVESPSKIKVLVPFFTGCSGDNRKSSLFITRDGFRSNKTALHAKYSTQRGTKITKPVTNKYCKYLKENVRKASIFRAIFRYFEPKVSEIRNCLQKIINQKYPSHISLCPSENVTGRTISDYLEKYGHNMHDNKINLDRWRRNFSWASYVLNAQGKTLKSRIPCIFDILGIEIGKIYLL